MYIKKRQGARTDPWATPDWTYQHISILLGREYLTDGIEISHFKTGNLALPLVNEVFKSINIYLQLILAVVSVMNQASVERKTVFI